MPTALECSEHPVTHVMSLQKVNVSNGTSGEHVAGTTARSISFFGHEQQCVMHKSTSIFDSTGHERKKQRRHRLETPLLMMLLGLNWLLWCHYVLKCDC